jgi:hypothetical protein
MSDNVFPTGACQSIHLPNFAITWVGANPLDEGFCFGSETGQIYFTDVEGLPVSPILLASASGESINGVAYSQNWLAATTRKDVNFIGPWEPRTQPRDVVSFFGGGNDVAVAPTSGHFVIPLGRDGVMFVKPGTGEKDPVTIGRSEKSSLNFCRVLALAGEGGNDVVVCAGRRGGLGFANYREGMRGLTMYSVTFKELDLVDICSLATPDKPLAVVAAAKDGSLVFFDNILTDKNPQMMKFPGVKGTIYRVLSSQGDIYLLTSKGLFGLLRLAARFIRGETLHHSTTEILRLSVQAADANTVAKNWLLAAEIDQVFKFDTENMSKSSENGSIAKQGDVWEEPEQLNTRPQWSESSLEQQSEIIATAI